MYTSTEQTQAPSCGVCGRKLGIGYYFSCHVCGAAYCYAHSPQKCNHQKAKQQPTKLPILR